MLEKISVAPQPARCRSLRIRYCRFYELGVCRIMLFFRIHEFAVGFLIPPGITEVRIHEEIALVHVTVHALAGGDGACELMHDRMTALGFRDRFVGGETEALMSVLAPPAGIRRRAIVRINNVAGRTTARAIIAGMIV